jgi:hypothetical protein
LSFKAHNFFPAKFSQFNDFVNGHAPAQHPIGDINTIFLSAFV